MNIILANKGTFLYFVAIVFVAIFVCGRTMSIALPISSETISVEITGDYCPSLEVQSGVRIAWTNLGDMDQSLILERYDENGESVRSGGTQFLDVGDTYTMFLFEPGDYIYYCTSDLSASGTITVLK